MDSAKNDNLWIDMQGITTAIKGFMTVLEKIHTWCQNHAEDISNFLLAIEYLRLWSIATDKLIANQIIFTDDLPQEMVEEIYNGADIEKIVGSYYFGNNKCNVERVISRCQQNEQVQKRGELYEQIISAYRRDHYLIACIGLFSMIDGVLADVSEQNVTNFKSRLNVINEKIEGEKTINEIDRKTLCICKAFDAFDTSVFFNSNLSGQEPPTVNRHWDLHGRTHRKHDKMDFLKVLLWLDAIIFSASQDTQESEEADNEPL